MAKRISIPQNVTERLYGTLSEFGCARWKAMLNYAECLLKSSGIPEGYAALSLQNLEKSGLATKTTYADENVIFPLGKDDASIASLNAFEAFSELVKEAFEEHGSSDFCDAGKSTEYPFHFFLNIRKVQYRLIVYGYDSAERISFYNGTYDEQVGRYFTQILVVPDVYEWEEFSDLRLKGKTRIAFIQQANARRNTYKCTLTDVIEEL